MYRLPAMAVVIASAFVLGLAAPVGAGTENPCKLLKRSAIARVLDAEVGRPRRGGPSCEWNVDASATRPSGAVFTALYLVQAKQVFNQNEEDFSDDLVEVSGLGTNAFYQPTGSDGVVWVLKGDVLLTVQGAFVALGDEPEPDPAAIQDELVELAKRARKRA
jgi:hypothetical protein